MMAQEQPTSQALRQAVKSIAGRVLCLLNRTYRKASQKHSGKLRHRRQEPLHNVALTLNPAAGA